MRKNKGITLIALVITIIVLLILAGVSISTLIGENGILTRATEAKEKNDIATLKEMIQTDTLGYQLENKSENITSEQYRTVLNKYFEGVPTTAKELEKELENKEYSLKAKKEYGEYNVKIADMYEGEIKIEEAKVGEEVTGKNRPYTKNGKRAIIPEGFTIVPGCDDISEGLVISDNEGDTELEPGNKKAEGNQFVWVPVEKFDEFKRENSYKDGTLLTYAFVSDAITSGKNYEPEGDGLTVDEEASTTEKEAQEMYKSVKDNKGFYIGRYEAGAEGGNYAETTGWSETIKMVCKKGVTPYNIKWGNSMTDDTEGAVEVARKFTTQEGYTSVKSTLCYSVQWDAIMRWMQGIENPNSTGKIYIQDSNGMGWYYNNSSYTIKETGTDIGSGENNKSNKVKNIYDMAGNVSEWTMEAYSTNFRINRGGCCNYNGSEFSASTRAIYNPTDNPTTFGFRPALYVNV